MEKVTIDKNELLEKIRANRAAHRQIFEEALEGYRQRAIRILDEQIKDLRDGKTPQIIFGLDRPQDHTRDYDRVIMRLDMHQGSVFLLSEQDFAQYVLDDWNWKRQWAVSNSGYVSAGTRSAHTDYFES